MRPTLLIIAFCTAVLINPATSFSKSYKYDDSLKIEVKNNAPMSSRYFGVIDFHFYNSSQEWVRINKPRISFPNNEVDENMMVTQGIDLLIWSEATRVYMEKQQAQAAIAGALIGGLALGMAHNTNNNFGKMLGGTILVTALVSPSLLRFNEDYDNEKSDAIFPTNHLFGGAIYIPPGLSVKRWLVLNSKNHSTIAYMVNRFLDPMVKGVIEAKGIAFNEELFALSEMVQFVFRSAIRDNKTITLYCPSQRMRDLFKRWLQYGLQDSHYTSPKVWTI